MSNAPELPPLPQPDGNIGDYRYWGDLKLKTYAVSYGAPLLAEIERLKQDQIEYFKQHAQELNNAVGKALGQRDKYAKERDALQRFKDFVHRRLDNAGVLTHPDGPHSAEGCRIGDRLDLLIGERDELRAKLEAAQKELAELNVLLDDAENDAKVDAQRAYEQGHQDGYMAARAENP